MPSRIRALRAIFAAVAVLGGLLFFSPVASAAPADPAVSRETLRALALVGRSAEVREDVTKQLAEDLSDAERAALLEVVAVADAWSDRGCPLPAETGEEAEDSPADWNDAILAARAELLRGAYGSALVHLRQLVDTAPSISAAARAVELRAIATAAIRAAQRPIRVRRSAIDEEPAFEKRWYGWQTLVADGIALTTAPFAPLLGLGVYAGGGPVVHLANGRTSVAAASLGLRVGAPLGGAAIGYGVAAITSPGRSGDSITYALFAGLGLVAGGATAVAIDSAVLAREKVAAQPKAQLARLTPAAAPRRDGGVDIGIAGVW